MTHRTAELRSIALHGIVAERIADDPAVVELARARVARWVADGEPVPPRWSNRWMQLLDGPRQDLLETLVADTEDARDLRQVSPFAGAVPEADRLRIIREIRRDAS